MARISYHQGVESFTISTINFSIHCSNKRFFDKALGLNQAYTYVVKINTVIMFIWIDNWIYTTAINKKCILFFFI